MSMSSLNLDHLSNTDCGPIEPGLPTPKSSLSTLKMDSGLTGDIPQIPTIGEILTVKRFFKPSHNSSVYPGDILRIVTSVSNTPGKISVCHPHSVAAFETEFHNFLPFGLREVCNCAEHRCGCVYENYERSRAFADWSISRRQTVSDPSALQGQSIGALLQVKRKPWDGLAESPDLDVDVGDIIKMERGIGSDHCPWKIRALNMRTGEKGDLLWRAAFPVGRRERCNCMTENQKCRCIYDDFDASMEYCNSHPDISYT